MKQQGLVLKYFVLKPSGTSPYHMASRAALLAYANCIEEENPALAKDLRKWEQRERYKSNGKKLRVKK